MSLSFCQRNNGSVHNETAQSESPSHETQPKIRVLVVDDEPSITQLLRMALTFDGWSVETAASGAEAIEKTSTFAPDVMVLDIMLGDISGLQVLSQLRAKSEHVPILFLTALDSVDDRVNGLTAGGDDYVVKPFSVEELIARLRALVRRTRINAAAVVNPVLQVGDLVLNEETFDVTRGGESITLTTTEFELLRFLMRNTHTVLSKTQILDRVWSYDFGGKQTVVELYISYLRRKIDAGRQPMIHTVRGVGYVLRPVD